MFSSFVNFLMATAAMIPFFGPPMPPTLVHQSFGCTNPAVRKEWRALSTYDRSEWIRAIKCLAKLPHNPLVIATQFLHSNPQLNTSSSHYDDFSFTHMDLGDLVHSTGRFLPWHRTFIHAAEIAMKQHCDYHGTSPYWDWTKDVADFYNSPIFSDPDPEAGLGGWGDSNTDARVLDGGFSHTSGFVLSYPFPHTLKRNFTLRPFLDFPDAEDWHVVPDMLGNMSLTPESIKKTVDSWIGDYRGFQADVEGKQAFHISVHSLIGADMNGFCTKDAPSWCNSNQLFSPNDPLFFLHHAMVDKVWRDWQLKHPENLNAFGGGSTQAKSGAENDIFPVGYPPDMKTTDYLESNGLFVVNLTIGDVLSTTGRYLCYVYE